MVNNGIYLLDGCTSVSVLDNVVVSDPYAGNEGIKLEGANLCAVLNNNVTNWAIDVTVDDGCVSCIVEHNLLGNPFSGVAFSDLGTDTQLLHVTVPFVDGTDPQDSGWLVNATTEYTRAFAMLPVEVQQVVRMKVYGRSAVTETHGMLADFTIYGAADNEAYTTHDGSVASRVSTSLNFAADDVIYWTITSAGVLALLGKDSVQVKAVYRGASSPNIDTQCYFRTVEVEYI
jgi:hypothetical protein